MRGQNSSTVALKQAARRERRGAHLEQLMQQGPFHSLVTAAATKPLLQHSLALTLKAAGDPGAGQQQVWVQDHHACMTSHLHLVYLANEHGTATLYGWFAVQEQLIQVLWQLHDLVPRPQKSVCASQDSLCALNLVMMPAAVQLIAANIAAPRLDVPS